MGKNRVPDAELEFARILRLLEQLEPEDVQELYGALMAKRRSPRAALPPASPDVPAAAPRRWWYHCEAKAVVLGRDPD